MTANKVEVLEGDAENVGAQSGLRQWAKRAIAAIAIAGSLGVMAAAPAHAASAQAGNGRVTVYFTKAETRAIGQGRVPAVPAAVPWQLRTAYYATAYGHRWFAQSYANRGWCSGFRLSIYPWESQGYFGYAC